MSVNVKTVLLNDSRLDWSDVAEFGVFTGPQSSTYLSYQSQDVSSLSQQLYVLTFPSEITCCQKDWLLDMTLTFQLTCTSGASSPSFLWGLDTALNSYPLHRLMTQLQLTINGNSTADQKSFTNQFYFNCLDSQENKYYEDSTPNALDKYLYYYDAQGQIDNVLSANNNPVAAGKDKCRNRGSFRILGTSTTYPVTENAFLPTNAAITTAYVKVRCIERLEIPPLTMAKPVDMSAFFGIINASVTISLNNGANCINTSRIDPNGTRTNTGNPTNYPTSCALYAINESNLRLAFISPKPVSGRSMPVVCYQPYSYVLPYITSFTPPALGGGTTTVVSRSCQFNSIPDKIAVFAPYVPNASKGIADSDSFYGIESISIMFDNTAGICSQMSSYQLWVASVDSGSTQTFEEWQGTCIRYDATNSTPKVVQTVGSMLILDFAKYVTISPSFLAPSSTGSFNFQVSVTLKNNLVSGRSTNPTTSDLVVLTLSSGIAAISSGTTLFSTSLLSRQEVLSCIERDGEKPLTRDEVSRYIGGGVSGGFAFDNLLGHLGKVASKLLRPMVGRVAESLAKSDSSVDKLLSHGLRKLASGDGKKKRH